MSEPSASVTHRAPRPAIPATVWALGVVSLCMDLSSELVHSLLPLFLVGTLGASPLALGLVEGIAEATAQIVKIVSGPLSDALGKRKLLLLAGYGLAALSKPLFPLAHSVDTVLFARFADRIGKGLRGAPRDALIADVAPAEIRGACFGLRQSMDTVGAVFGPLLAIVLMLALAGNISHVLWVAVLPALLSVAVIVFGVRDSAPATGHAAPRVSLGRATLAKFSARYWQVVAIGAVFSLARFSEAFLVLRASQLGLSASWAPAAMVVMALFYAASAYPAGRLSDHLDRGLLLALGLVLLVLSDLVLAAAAHPAGVFLGVALWGLHMGCTQGILATLVADTTPAGLKGSAFGIFNLVSGLAMLAASVLAGWLWQHWGAATTFATGAGLAASTLVLLLATRNGRAGRAG